MGKVISMLSRRESWCEAYVSPDGNMVLNVSSHGNAIIALGGKTQLLKFIDVSHLVYSVNEKLKEIFGSGAV